MSEQHPFRSFHFCPQCGSKQFVVNNFKSNKCLDCGFIYYYNTAAAVAVFITDAQGRLLVARRAHDPAKGTFDLPGGFVDLDETAEEAAIREVQEETGLKIANLRYLFSVPNIYVYSGFEVCTLDLVFETQLEQVDTSNPSDDVSELFLLHKDEIDPQKFGLLSVRKAVECWLKQ